MESTCPNCETEFEAEAWENGKCPKCGMEYYWDELWVEDYSDCWAMMEWDWDSIK